MVRQKEGKVYDALSVTGINISSMGAWHLKLEYTSPGHENAVEAARLVLSNGRQTINWQGYCW